MIGIALGFCNLPRSVGWVSMWSFGLLSWYHGFWACHALEGGGLFCALCLFTFLLHYFRREINIEQHCSILYTNIRGVPC